MACRQQTSAMEEMCLGNRTVISRAGSVGGLSERACFSVISDTQFSQDLRSYAQKSAHEQIKGIEAVWYTLAPILEFILWVDVRG